MITTPPTGVHLPPSPVAVSRRAELSPSDFWRLLLTQLQMQDPLSTTDTQQMLQQFVALQNAREMARLSTSLQRVETLLLLGHEVEWKTGGASQRGTVIGAALGGEAPLLTVRTSEGTTNISYEDITSVVSSTPTRLFLLERA